MWTSKDKICQVGPSGLPEDHGVHGYPGYKGEKRAPGQSSNGVAGFQNVMLEEMIAFLSLNIAML